MIRRNGLPLSNRAMLPPASPDFMDTWYCLACDAKVSRSRRPWCLEHSEYAQGVIEVMWGQGVSS